MEKVTIKQIDTHTCTIQTNKDLLQQTEGSHAQFCAHTVIPLSRKKLITWALLRKLKWELNIIGISRQGMCMDTQLRSKNSLSLLTGQNEPLSMYLLSRLKSWPILNE